MTKLIFILLSVFVLILPLKTLAQLENIPQLIDLFNTFQTFQKINEVKPPFLEKAFQDVQSAPDSAGGVISDLTSLFNRINSWFQDKLGVGLIDIIKAIGNFIVGVLEFIVKLIKAGLSLIQ